MGGLLNYLDRIDHPNDLKRLNRKELPEVASEIRAFITETTKYTGGHIGSGLGVAELTVALHYIFDFEEKDHLIFDVGHQCYPHKILTGRRERMRTLRQKDGLSGFPNPDESVYDRVKTGHGGTSLSTAIGMAVAMQKDPELKSNRVVALIGDAALQEGVALEALHHGGALEELPLVVILNDNAHGIGPAVGALSKSFSLIRSGSIYRFARGRLKRFVKKAERKSSRLGQIANDVYNQLKMYMHGFIPKLKPRNLFETLDFFYYGPIDGHDIPTLLEALRICRSFKRPVILHCITQKGKGHSEVQDRLAYHAGKPDSSLFAHLQPEHTRLGKETFTDVFANQAIQLAEQDEDVMAITAAMADGTGLIEFKKRFPERFHDVGMAEQHAVGLAQGLALGGKKPLCAVYSTFMQRAFDQIFQELSLINTSVVLCLDRAGVVGPDGATHNGVFDIAYCRMFPNMTLMAPRDGKLLRQMMRLALHHQGPSAIRFPRTRVPHADAELPAGELVLGRAEQLVSGNDGTLIAYGSMVYICLDVLDLLKQKHGLSFSLIDARFAKPLDGEMIRAELTRQAIVFTVEEHVVAGGFGSAVMEWAQKEKLPTEKLSILAIEDEWIEHGHRAEALETAGLSANRIVERIMEQVAVKAPEVHQQPIARIIH